MCVGGLRATALSVRGMLNLAYTGRILADVIFRFFGKRPELDFVDTLGNKELAHGAPESLL
eukprot:16449404-Heterocapsa_arctica.AAC.1